MEDNELVALLDRKFAESEERMTARMDARFDQVDARFEQVDTRFEQVDTRFEQVDTRFEQMDAKFDDHKIEVGARLDQMHSDIKKIAEGVDNVGEKLERFRKETARNFKDVKQTIGVANAALDSRLRKLEKVS